MTKGFIRAWEKNRKYIRLSNGIMKLTMAWSGKHHVPMWAVKLILFVLMSLMTLEGFVVRCSGIYHFYSTKTYKDLGSNRGVRLAAKNAGGSDRAQ